MSRTTSTLGVMLALACGGATRPVVRQRAEPRAAEAAPERPATPQEQQSMAKAAALYRELVQGGLTSDECRRAADAFGAVADDHPQLVEARHDQGALLEQCGDLDGAKKAYEHAIDANPKYAESLSALGGLALRTGDEGRAMELFDRAVKADPKNAAGYLGEAVIQRRRALHGGDPQTVQEAIGNVRRVLALDSENMEAYGTLAQIIYDQAGGDQTKLDLALLVCEQARKIRDDYAPIYNTRGLIWLQKNNVTLALSHFKKAAEIDPDFVEAQLNIGAITLNFRDYDTAAGAFRAVLKNRPKNVDALIGLGVALRGKRDVAGAEAQYKAAAAAAPDNPAPTYNLGILYQDYMQQTPEQLNQAIAYFEEFMRRSVEKPKIDDCKQRIKNIQDTFKAIEEAKAMQAEMEKMQKQMEEQQRQMQQQAPVPAPAPEAAPAAPAAPPPPNAPPPK